MSIVMQTGTRQPHSHMSSHPPSRSIDRTMQQDLGMTKRVSASITFVASPTNQLQAANGTFANFAVDDIIVVEGTNLNNAILTVQAIDVTNQSYLTVDNPPKTEGPITATVRSL
jgi:hypothetical protein